MKMKLGLVILLLSASAILGEPTPTKNTDTLKWTASQSKEVTGYKIYEVVNSKNVLLGESKTNTFEIPRKRGKHVYMVTAISPNAESVPSTPLEVRK